MGAGVTLEGEEPRAEKVQHRSAARKPFVKLENPASVDRLQSLVAGLAGTKQRDLKPLLKSGVALKPKTLLKPDRSLSTEIRQSRPTLREGDATKSLTDS